MTAADIVGALALMAGTSEGRFAERARELAPVIVQEARRAQVDPLVVAAIALRESSLISQARGRRGELGVMQVMPATGAHHCKGLNLLDARQNIRCGARLLGRAMRACGDVGPALSRYNGNGCVPSRYSAKVLAMLSRREAILATQAP